jgi:hypothetical protein
MRASTVASEAIFIRADSATCLDRGREPEARYVGWSRRVVLIMKVPLRQASG